ncbi:Forkhead box protein L1 [Coemansia sp. RSA 1358]|nr:Forkhead box protein L1 [Coemansia umbellata]KAJ2621094.1 Forkhead box protein L1 [Coemansia sp. RSA 1358]
MNSEFSTPSRSQQHSPAPLPSQHLAASVCSDTQLPTPAVMPYPLPMGHMDIVTPTTAVDLGSAHFAYLKDAFSQRPFSPSSMDFASMNIASGYHTPHAATPVVMHSKQQQQQQQSVSTDALAVIPTSAPLPEVTTAAAASTADDDADTCTAESASAGTPSPDKPDYSYASLIAQSLIDAPMQRRTLNGIYEWIQEHFPYYRTRQNWQNSIRHNLSLNKGFMKVKRDEAHPGKGSFWTFTPGYESCLNSGHFKPIRSRSGRAALAAAAALATSKALSASYDGISNTDIISDTESTSSPDRKKLSNGKCAPGMKKAEKKTIRSIKAAKSLKRSHSLPPKEQRIHLNQNGASSGAAAASIPAGNRMAPASPAHLVHSDTIPATMSLGRSSAKKMRMSSSQSHSGAAGLSSSASSSAALMAPTGSAAAVSAFSNIPAFSYPQTPSFAPSPAPFIPSPALMSTASMSVVNTATQTPLHQSAQFQFHMPSPCSIPLPMSAMDVASVPTTSGNSNTGSYPMGAAFFGGPLGGDPVASANIDGVSLFSADTTSMGTTSDGTIYTSRRSNVPSRISWHGPESMTQAFANLQQQHHQHSSNNMGMSMGLDSADLGLSMFADGRSQVMNLSTDNSVNASPAEWAVFTGMPAPTHASSVAAAAELSIHAPSLHQINSMGAIDAHTANGNQQQQFHHHQQQQSRMAGLSAIDAAAPVNADNCNSSSNGNGNGNQGILAFYDEMIRDPTSLMNVFGQDLSGWQCPTKTNTIDPAALCAVDPETNSL